MNLSGSVKISGLMICLMCLFGCKGGEKSVEMGPVETVEAFYKAVSAGRWDEAESLCDTLSMSGYIESHRNAWSRFGKEDEGAAKVARSIFENTAVKVEDTHKADDKRIVTYTLETDGLSKTRKATLRKEAGVWKVEAITEAN